MPDKYRRNDLTAYQVDDLLRYDDETGTLFWKPRPLSPFNPGKHQVRICNCWNSKFAGKQAGTISITGRLMVSIYQRDYLAHRIVWLLKTGTWPKDQIDHIDGDPLNNRFSNLRESTQAENVQNIFLYRNNKSGYQGVSWSEANGKWLATIQIGRRQRYLGVFSSAEEASKAYLEAKSRLHTFQPAPRYL